MSSPTIRRLSPHRGARGLLAVSCALSVLVLAACSSGGSGSGGPGERDEAAVAAAEERLAPFVAPVEEIQVDTPLTERPAEGKRGYFIRYNNENAAIYDEGTEAAADALGWDVEILPVDGSDPQAQTNAMLRAVNEKVDFIVVTAGNLQSAAQGMDAAREAGIPVFFGAGVGEPQGDKNGLYGNTYADGTMASNLVVVDQMIVDSGGAGSALYVNAPDFPILAPIDDAVKKRLADHCSKCSVDLLPISAADLGGDIASNIVARIRQNPDIKYVILSFNDLANGLAPALQAAALDDVKVYITDPSEATAKMIADGTYAAGSAVPRHDYPWLLFDQIARVSVGMDPLQEQHATTGFQLWTEDNMPNRSDDWTWDPPNYEEQYKKLWQIS